MEGHVLAFPHEWSLSRDTEKQCRMIIFMIKRLIYSKESRVEVGACILVHKFVRILSVMDRPNTDPPQ